MYAPSADGSIRLAAPYVDDLGVCIKTQTQLLKPVEGSLSVMNMPKYTGICVQVFSLHLTSFTSS